jgi:hypothetical protein
VQFRFGLSVYSRARTDAVRKIVHTVYLLPGTSYRSIMGMYMVMLGPALILGTIAVYKTLDSRKGADSARSVGVVIQNTTRRKLKRQQIDLSHGEWTEDSHPPMEIDAAADDNSVSLAGFMVESHGTMTGCEGFVIYAPEDLSQFPLRIDFNNPYVGSNSHRSNVGGGGRFHERMTGGEGNNCNIVVTFSQCSPRDASGQY